MNALIRSAKREIWYLWLKARGQVLEKLALLRKLQASSAEIVRNFQEQRLLELLLHAWLYVPFWHERLEGFGVVRGGVVNLDLFHDLPVLTRSEVQEHYERMLATNRDTRRCEEFRTSGSTGEPTRIVQDREYNEWNRALKLLFDSWTGYVPGQPQVRLWGLTPDRANPPLRLKVGRWLRNECWLNGFFMSDDDMSRYLELINRIKPRQIFAYVESLHLLTEFAETQGAELHVPDSLVTSAGTLFPRVRNRIERHFQAALHDRYGAVEAGDIAMERRGQPGLYVAPTHIVEILDDAGRPVPPGEIGQVVVTVLTNYAMPLIRYGIGDLARQAPVASPEGIQWPQLAQLVGRVNECIRTPEGRRIHGIFFECLVDELPFVRRYQVHQTALDRLVMRIVPARATREVLDAHAPDLAVLASKIQKEMGPACRVEYEIVPRIEPGSSGKFRHVISDLAP